MDKSAQKYKYFAFISYNNKDMAWGKRLHRKLEHYRMPSTLCSERGWKRKPMNPVFFAPAEIQPGGLDEELQQRLRVSRHLVVVCSPNSARSRYVADEIRYFHSLGHPENIHFFIVDGLPHSNDPQTDCFNPVINELGMPEILAANIHEPVYRLPLLNRERAYVQLVTKLLGVEFDTLWQRHRRQFVNRVVAWVMGCLAVLAVVCGVWKYNQPVDVHIAVNEVSISNKNLPPLHDIMINVKLENDSLVRVLPKVNDQLLFPNVPRRFLNTNVQLSVRCVNAVPLDTVMALSQNMQISLKRDETVYGSVRFRLYDASREQFVSGVVIRLDSYESVSDEDGWVVFDIPMQRQRQSYRVQSSVPLEKYEVTMPSGEDDVLIVK